MVTTTTRKEARPPKPARMPLNIEEIPHELRGLPRWVVWSWTWRRKSQKYDKPPLQTNGSPASSTDPTTWTRFESAAVATFNRNDGIGFVLGTDVGIVGVDLDDCRNPDTCEIFEPAASIIKKLDSYAEVSPSGTGVKILLHGQLPEKCTKVNHSAGVEVYGEGRYFTITGQRVPSSPADVNERQHELEWLLSTFVEQKHGENGRGSLANDDIEVSRSALAALRPDRADGYWDWLQIGMALHSVSDSLLPDWERFSVQSPKYTDGDCQLKWKSFRRSGVGLGTLIHLAKQDGWTPPKRKRKTYQGNCSSNGGNGEDSDELTIVTNCTTIDDDEDGSEKTIPLSMAEIIDNIHELTQGWPKRIGDSLFIHDRDVADHRVDFLKSESSLFGFFHSRCGVHWTRGARYVTKTELFAELQRSAESFDMVERLPHEPKFKRHYYVCGNPNPAVGAECERFQELIDRFSPATEVDRDLIQAAFMTPGWGGPAGSRPSFVITSDKGRGCGKTTLAELVGSLWGGILSFSHREEIGKIKTRLLTPDAMSKRVCLLDNVKSLKFSWAELEGMITSTEVGGHRMYCGDGARPNTMTWFITLNGASLSTDMAQRAVIIKLEKPNRTGEWSDDTRRFIEDHREEIIAGIIHLLRQPAQSLEKFSRWACWERDVLARTPEPSEAQKVIEERQTASDVEIEEGEMIEEFFASKLAWLGYNVAVDWVLIPSRVANEWYCKVQNDRVTTSQTSRILKQMASEGRLKRLKEHRSGTERGFMWTTDVFDRSYFQDIHLRISDKAFCE